MSINVFWKDSTKTTLQYNLEGSWTWNDFERANLKAYDLMSSVEHQVSIILNLTHCLELPTNALTALRRMLIIAPPNLRLVVFSGTNETDESMIRVLAQFDQLLGKYITLTHSLETAQRLVKDFNHTNDADTNRSYPA